MCVHQHDIRTFDMLEILQGSLAAGCLHDRISILKVFGNDRTVDCQPVYDEHRLILIVMCRRQADCLITYVLKISAEFLQHLFKFCRRQRLGEIIALCQIAVHATQQLQLFFRLHTLGYHIQIHPFCQSDDKAHDSSGIIPLGIIFDKIHIQLQHVDRHRCQHIERRITAAEIIHLDLEAFLFQFLNNRQQLIRILHIGALRDLQMQMSRLQSVPMHGIQ